MNEKKKLGGWERLVIFLGIVFTIPIGGGFIWAIAEGDQPEALALALIGVVIIWAIVGSLLWTIKGFKG